MPFHSYALPGTWANLSTTERMNFIYDADLVSDAVRITLSQSVTSGTYEVYNYDGDLLASGSVTGTQLDIPDAVLVQRDGRGPYGWYRVLIRGVDRADGQYNDSYGCMSFYRVKDDANFAANPIVGTSAGSDAIADLPARGVMGLGSHRFSVQHITELGPGVNGTSSSTSVSTGGIGDNKPAGTLHFFGHTFIGDGSELATPTKSSGTATMGTPYMVEQVVQGTVTLTLWAWLQETTGSLTVSFSSGTKSGTHRLRGTSMRGDRSGIPVADNFNTPDTDSGVGTSASMSLSAPSWAYPTVAMDQAYPSMHVVFAAADNAVTWGNWANMENTFASNPANDCWGVTRFKNVAAATYNPSITWNTSSNFATITVAIKGLVDDGTVDSLIADLNAYKTYWADQAPASRPRLPIINLVDGIQYAGGWGNEIITAIEAAYDGDIVWELYNEPNFTTSTTDYVDHTLIPGAAAVKAANPTSLVVGPGVVSVTNVSGGLSWIETVLARIADDNPYPLDGISIHPYNGYLADLNLMRRTFATFHDLLVEYGIDDLPLFMTEQGHAYEYRGIVWPKFQGRWGMLMAFVQELEGLPLEHNSWWYDRRHGFDDFPYWWVNDEGPGPIGLLTRTMAAETFDRPLAEQYTFSGYGSQMYAAGRWEGADGTGLVGVVAQSDGLPDLQFTITGASSLTFVDPWGNEDTVAVTGGVVTVPTYELPSWLRLPNGVTATLVDEPWTLRSTGATITASIAGNGGHFTNAVVEDPPNYWTNTTVTGAWQKVPHVDAITYTEALAAPSTCDRLIVHGTNPDRNNGVPMDFTVEISANGTDWTEVYEHVADETYYSFTSRYGRCRVETYWNERNVWVIPFTRQTVSHARVIVTRYSIGQYPNSTVAVLHQNDQWGATNTQASIRSLLAYDTGQEPDPDPPLRTVLLLAAS